MDKINRKIKIIPKSKSYQQANVTYTYGSWCSVVRSWWIGKGGQCSATGNAISRMLFIGLCWRWVVIADPADRWKVFGDHWLDKGNSVANWRRHYGGSCACYLLACGKNVHSMSHEKGPTIKFTLLLLFVDTCFEHCVALVSFSTSCLQNVI